MMPTRAPIHKPNAKPKKRRENRLDATQRGYNARWRKRRKYFLQTPGNQLCVMCLKQGRIEAATDVDHIIPHRGLDDPLFHDEDNLQPLCGTCHKRKTGKERDGWARK